MPPQALAGDVAPAAARRAPAPAAARMSAGLLDAPAAGTALRPITAADVPEAGRVLHRAFAGVQDRHGCPRQLPEAVDALALIGSLVRRPGVWGVAALRDGRLVGSAFLDERGPVRGVGPVSVDPAVQGTGVGRRLLEVVLARGGRAPGVRLMQDAFNGRSIALAASLGFRVTDPVALVQGLPTQARTPGVEVRALTEGDLGECEALEVAVHGSARTDALRQALDAPGAPPLVAVRERRVVAFAAGIDDPVTTYAAAAHAGDLAALLTGAARPLSFLLPLRQDALLRWALDEGLRLVRPLTAMTLGTVPTPRGAWLPSVFA